MEVKKTPHQPWIVIEIPGGDLALELLGEQLMELGGDGLTTESGKLRAFFPQNRWNEKKYQSILEIASLFSHQGLIPSDPVTYVEIEEEDWVGRWRKALGPIRAGKHFVVVPPGIGCDLSPKDIVLHLDPRRAFGTGEHPTTRMALELLENTFVLGERVLDLGCGNGVLSIAALLMGASYATAIDFEEESVEETFENAERHKVDDRITVIRADVLELDLADKYKILLANIFLRPILFGLESWLELLEPDSTLIFTGIQEGQQALDFQNAAIEAGLKIEEMKTENGWFAARCKS